MVGVALEGVWFEREQRHRIPPPVRALLLEARLPKCRVRFIPVSKGARRSDYGASLLRRDSGPLSGLLD